MNFLPQALQSLACALIQPGAVQQPAASRPQPQPQREERRWGCGWFDSSLDLEQGLQLQELSSPEEMASELPLAFWLQIDLAGRASGLAA